MTKAVLEAGKRGCRGGKLGNPLTGARGSGKPACFADGAARPARPGQETAQIGAAIGREFSHALLAAVVRKPEAELKQR